MDWLEIMRLILAIWPLIEKILEMIADENERDTKYDAVTTALGRLLTGQDRVANSGEAVALITDSIC